MVKEDLLETNQLLRAMLFPASWQTPKTAFTFEVLESLESLSSYGRLSAYDYYHSLRRLSDAQGTENWPVRLLIAFIDILLTP